MHVLDGTSAYFYYMRRVKSMRNRCVLVVVVLAVLIGVIYYWSDVKENEVDEGGTLVYLEERVLWE